MTNTTAAPLARSAGPLALVAGLVLVVSDLVTWSTIDAADKVGTSLDPIYQLSGVAYMIGFVLLALALVALHGRQSAKAGAFGGFAFACALTGTFLLGGDLWFETFVVPWTAAHLPEIYEAPKDGLLVVGALASYLSFAVGWALFGIASFRAGVFPRLLCVALAIAGLLGFHALVPPYGVPIGLVVAGLGLWVMRQPQTSAA